jgi:hypothetical protein
MARCRIEGRLCINPKFSFAEPLLRKTDRFLAVIKILFIAMRSLPKHFHFRILSLYLEGFAIQGVREMGCSDWRCDLFHKKSR